MYKGQRWKLVVTLIILGASIWYIWPSLRVYTMPKEQFAALPEEQAEHLRDKALRLGLDIQGGMHLVLEVDQTGLNEQEAKDAVDRAREVIENRVNQFGVAEPLIQRQGDNRIVVQLPGLLDPQRAKTLIGQTALLEFVIVKTPDETRALLDRLDAAVATRVPAATDTSKYPYFDPAKPISSRMLSLEQGGIFFADEDVPDVKAFLAEIGADTVAMLDSRLLWGVENAVLQGRSGKILYFLEKKAELTGAEVATARVGMGMDVERPDAPGVLLNFTRRGATIFSRVTGANVGRQLAIVLDGVVRSDPVIRERIPRGEASITGSFSDKEAGDLSIVLRAGALPAPLNVIEERTVGPSLGQDSVEKGMRAAIIGSMLVILFMLIYYRFSGCIAVIALALNIWLLLAVLGAFHATLTLPGIAGIILTIGMAVDANVLIFERIREELRTGKTVARSIEFGYQRAFRTILDSNVTTLITALVLFQFGTGPIKGFAVTLSIGIIANMFTAVFVTKIIFDAIVARRRLETLSI
ncbi:MAG: protein translocase subunit SecD [Candidatus Eisenbacteria bacterium]|nr:protein translocase subunit SecD [Candidatus Eisenbacteria bacterium]